MPVNYTATLTVGLHVIYDGEKWTINAIHANRVDLVRLGAARTSVQLTRLLSSSDFQVLQSGNAATSALGPIFDAMDDEEYQELRTLERHIREVTTGYAEGCPELALPGEPRPQYRSSVPKMERYSVKATELGMSVPWLRAKARRYRDDGLAGLVDRRTQQPTHPYGRVDERWIREAEAVLAEHTDASQPPVLHIIDRTNARTHHRYGADVALPSTSTARRALQAMTKGRQAFAGKSAKQKRSIADRPATPYGRLRAWRIGQYVLLDTTPLDVFAMDPLTLRWLPMQLTVAMDLATRCICGLRLSPVSAKAVDAAVVLYETISPDSRSHTSSGLLPYAGVPGTVLVPAQEQAGLPGAAPETIIIDHGKMYMAQHVLAVCERLGISVQPARVYTGTDKSPLERFFRTIREDLLAALPGYKGPDVYSRGKDVEDDAFYFCDELEGIIRDWVATRYHERQHDGLADPSLPGQVLTPREMWAQLSNRSPELRIPARSDLAYDFLPMEWRTIQHYGVELLGLRFDGAGLQGYRNTSSPFASQGGKWPIRYDPEDARQVYFQRPDDHSWHALRWEHAVDFPQPFSDESLKYARKLAVAIGRHGDDRAVLAELLERWDAGLLESRSERRMAVRLSARRAALALAEDDAKVPQAMVADRRLVIVGDDDTDEEVSALGPDEQGEADFYDDALAVGQ